MRAGIELVSAKSSMGHAEAGAGALGIMRAVGCLQKCTVAPLTHLRNINTHVQDVLYTTSMTCISRLPRQDAPGAIGGQQLSISSFAFQVWHSAFSCLLISKGSLVLVKLHDIDAMTGL